jgi:Cu-Zn family superoxide dismutase
MKIDLTNAAPGVHAIHVHKVGKCEAPSFESAGDHVALTASVHGFHNARGPHTGDLPNLDVPSTKRVSVEHMLPGVTLAPGATSLLDADGSALVIHAGKDDYATDPAGDSGDRIACGRIAS